MSDTTRDIEREDTKRRETLEEVAKGLHELDWCIGYELSMSNHLELDRLRELACSLFPLSPPSTHRLRE
jgi:hypothetical protein